MTLVPSSPLGADVVRGTIYLSLACYTAATALMLRRPSIWGWLTRWLWAAGWLIFVIHVLTAFHVYHAWSFDHAFEHTRDVAWVGEGLYVSFAFGVLWGLDAAWWLVSPASHARRPRWVGWGLHAFMAFILFNGTIVFESGLARGIGVAATALLLALCLTNRRPASPGGQSA